MKNISESISDNLKKQLYDLINSDNFDDDDARYLLNAAAPLNKSEESISRFNKLKYYIASRFIGGKNQGELAYEAILNILQKTNSLDSFLTNIIDKYEDTDKGFTGKQLATAGLKGVANIYDFFSPLGLSREAMQQLAKLKYSVGGVIQGEFEVLTSLLISDLIHRDQRMIKSGINKGKFIWMEMPKGHGDIYSESAEVEYKCPSARVKDQKIGAAALVQKTFKDSLKSKGLKEMLIVGGIDGGDLGKSNANNTIFELLKNNISFEEICDMLGEAFAEQLKAGSANAKEISKFFQSHEKDLIKNGVFNDVIWSRCIGCVQLKYYQAMAKWNYIMIFCGKSGAEASNIGNYIAIDTKEASNLEKIYSDERIYFTGFLNNDSGWADAVHIYAK